MPPRTRAPRRSPRQPKDVVTITHAGDARPNIATAELEAVMAYADRQAVRVAYQRRNRDLDPQLVWRGKDGQDAADLVVAAPPLFIQEKIHPKALVDDLVRLAQQRQRQQDGGAGGSAGAGGSSGTTGTGGGGSSGTTGTGGGGSSGTTGTGGGGSTGGAGYDDYGGYGGRQAALDLFADFNGLDDPNARTDFYRHEVNWSNRLILGDSLQVMASLAEREGLRGQVQCIYIDPPYGIRFNSNFQWSTTSRDVRDGNPAHITREPEQVKAFRDTWRDGIHTYLSYLRDRLTVARDLLADSGSVFVQIGDENVHRVRAVMDEVFGEKNFVSMITYRTSSGTTQRRSVKRISDYIIWYCKNSDYIKFRRLLEGKPVDTKMYNQLELQDGLRRPMTREERLDPSKCPEGSRPYQKLPMHSMASGDHSPRKFFESVWRIPPMRSWRYSPDGFDRLGKASRIQPDITALRAVYYNDDYPAYEISNSWEDTGPELVKSYVVQTSLAPIQRCILMTTDPGDLVLDPTCGAGTTAYVAEQWGRRWITIDTSRVALALARARLMGARYPYYLLADSPEGQRQAAAIARRASSNGTGNGAGNGSGDAAGNAAGDAPPDAATYGELRQGFVYQRVPHITLRDIANNGEIDAIWDAAEQRLAPLREQLSAAIGQPPLPEWELPRECPEGWPAAAGDLLAQYWAGRGARQREIDASIAANANFEYLYDKPYEDRRKVRVAGPFTVESLSPHRVISADEDGLASLPGYVGPGYAESGAADTTVAEAGDGYRYRGEAPAARDFAAMILDNLRIAGVQQAHKDDKINFSSLVGWPGEYICAEGRFVEGGADDDADDGGDADGDDAGVPRRAAIFIGPEFGTVSPADLTAAGREAGMAGFDVLIACAFSYDAHASALSRLGALPILKARMNADLHMADDLKNTGQGNLFVVFGEPDVELLPVTDADTDGDGNGSGDDAPWWQVKVKGVDIYHPGSGQVRSNDADSIACWFVDTDYNEASFFVRQAYFLGASSDPYRALKTTLKAEVDAEAWASLRSDTSRPFPRPESGRIAVKVINHLGDEAMTVLPVG